ncbi:MAG: hypothetical protein KBA43_07960 [Paludibacteraceae bacterium]|jgi:hypothetical protein|nr:hypothetical protein [Paludibacteraceae bacterium]
MVKTLDEFFKENEIRIGEGKDFTTNPPLYYQSLNDAFYNYFKTVRNNKDTYHFLLNFSQWNREGVAFNFSNTDSAVFMILGFHRFFELLIKDILSRINPLLSVKFPEDEEDAIKLLNQELSSEQMETVEFRKAFERFKEAIKYHGKNPKKTEYAIIRQFSFLNDDTLNRLAKWRNRIMHNGSNIPNIYLLDYLVSQKIIPIVDKVVETDKDNLKNYRPHFFETFSGINIIEEIKKIKFDFKDFYVKKNGNELALKILRLAHLKELGRATYNLELTLKNNISFYEPYYQDPIGRNRRFAEQEKSHPSFFAIKKCPCCGYETLVVYRSDYDDVFSNKKDFISWFNCITCTYSLKNNLGDPEYFGYCNEKLFPSS